MVDTLPSRLRWLSVFGLSLVLVPSTLLAQPSFTTVDGGPYAQEAVGVLATGGTYTVAVRIYAPDQGHRAEVRTYSAQGVLQSTQSVGPAGNVFIQAMVPAPGGGAYVVGSVIAPDSADQDALVIRLTSTFSVSWTTVVPLAFGQVLHGAAVLADGRLVATGAASGADKHDALVMCFATTGPLDWWSTVPGPLDEEGLAVASDATGIMITGRQVNYGGTTDCLFARLDLFGNLQWNTSWGGNRNDIGRAFVRTTGGAFIMAGGSDSYSAYDQNLQNFPQEVLLIAIDTNGDTLWTRHQGLSGQQQQATALGIASSGDLYLAGERWVSGERDALVMRTNAFGVPVWERTEDTGRNDLPLAIQALSGGCAVAGTSMTDLGQQVLLIRLDGNGN